MTSDLVSSTCDSPANRSKHEANSNRAENYTPRKARQDADFEEDTACDCSTEDINLRDVDYETTGADAFSILSYGEVTPEAKETHLAYPLSSAAQVSPVHVISLDPVEPDDLSPDNDVADKHPKAASRQCEQPEVYDDIDDDFHIPSPAQFEAMWQARSEVMQRNMQQQEMRWLEEARNGHNETPENTSGMGDGQKRLARIANQGYKQTADENCMQETESDESDSTMASSSGDNLNKMKKKVEWYKVNSGPAEPVTLSSMTSLAEALQKAGRYTEAAYYYRIVCEKRESMLANHPETWRVFADFGLLQMERAEIVQDKAELLAQADLLLRTAIRGLAQCSRTTQITHQYWKIQNNLCLCLLKRGQEHIEEALDIAKMVAENYSALFGTGSIFTLDALLHYAIALLKVFENSEAESILACWNEYYQKRLATDPKHNAEIWGYCRWLRILGGVYHQQGKMDAAHRLFERAFHKSEHVQDARALLSFLRKTARWSNIQPLMDTFNLIRMLRRDKRCLIDFPDGEMLKWYDVVTRTAGAAAQAGTSDTRPECLYRTALEGYQRLHNNFARSGPETQAMQKVIEKRSMHVLQKLGDWFASEASQASDSDSLWFEAENCWSQVIFTTEVADCCFVNSDLSLDSEDPTYRSAYALSYRYVQHGRAMDARNLFDRFVITPILEQRKRVVRTRHRRVSSTGRVAMGDTLQQVADVVCFVNLNVAARDFEKAEHFLRSIIIENSENCSDRSLGRNPDMRSNVVVARTLLIMALGDVFTQAENDVEAKRITDMLRNDVDAWTSLNALVMQYVNNSKNVGVASKNVGQEVDRTTDDLGARRAHLGNPPWTPEAQCHLAIVRLAERLNRIRYACTNDLLIGIEKDEAVEAVDFPACEAQVDTEFQIAGDTATLEVMEEASPCKRKIARKEPVRAPNSPVCAYKVDGRDGMSTGYRPAGVAKVAEPTGRPLFQRSEKRNDTMRAHCDKDDKDDTMIAQEL